MYLLTFSIMVSDEAMTLFIFNVLYLALTLFTRQPAPLPPIDGKIRFVTFPVAGGEPKRRCCVPPG
jgi:hypothetical protein